MPIRLIALDLDGTTLRHDLSVHPHVQEAFVGAREANVNLVIATGRAHQSTVSIANRIGFEGSFVCINGAYATNVHGETVFSSFLNEDVISKVLEFADHRQLHVSAYTPQGPVANRDSEWLTRYRELVKGIHVDVQAPDLLKQRSIHKLVIIADADQIPLLRADLQVELLGCGCQLTESAPQYLEILPEGTNKGNGLAQLCASMGIDRSEVAAIGDYKNDLEMLAWVGTAGAVKNALDEVKSLAQIVVNSNEDGGAGEFIFACLRLNCNSY
ncbi:MAG TPA: HAD family hydrolase [Fimbriimonas sp.]|nr:HAD family hydrolase [Fimbriimonas sp.]